MTGRMVPAAPPRLRLAAVVGLVVFHVLAGTRVGHALWSASATTTATVTGGVLGPALAGTEGLTAENISTPEYTTPVELTLHNTGSEPLDLALAIATDAGTLDPAQVELVLWQRTGTSCPIAVPSTGTVTGTLAVPPALPTTAATGEGGWTTVVCAATRFTGTVFGSAGRSLTAGPALVGRLAGTSWSATTHGPAFTQTIAPAPPPVTDLTCTDRNLLNLLGLVVGGEGIQLTWNTVPTTNRYQVRSATGGILADITTTGSTTAAAELGDAVDPGSSVKVVAVGSTGYSTEVSHPVHRDSLLGLRCGTA